MSKFLHADYSENDAKAIAILWIFSENSRAENLTNNDGEDLTDDKKNGNGPEKIKSYKHL